MTRKELLKKRTYAFYTDLTIVAVLQKFIVLTYINCVRELLTTTSISTQSKLLSHTYQLALPTLTFTLFTYFFACYYFNHGTTLGKAIFGLRVYNTHNLQQDLSIKESIIRSMVYSFCYLGGGVLLALPFLRKDAKGFPDFFSQTQVTTLSHYQELVGIKQAQMLKLHENTETQLKLFAA